MGDQRSPKHTGKIHLTPEEPGFLQALVVPELVNGWLQLKQEVRNEIRSRLLAKFGDQKAAANHFGISQATMSERLNGRKGFIGTDLVDILTEVKMVFSAAMVQEVILRNFVESRHNLILELTAASVYAQEVGMPAIRALFDIGHGYLHKFLHKYEQLGLLTVRSKSEGVKKAGQYSHYTSTEVPEPYLTTFVQDNKLTKHQSELLIASMLLTDGSLGQYMKKYTHSKRQYLRYRIEFFGRSQVLNQIFVDLMFHVFQVKPSTYMRRRKDGLRITGYVGIKAEKPAKTLLNISPSYKTSPGRSIALQYLLNEPQPTLRKILRADLKTKTLAFRLGMSCEGSVRLQTGSDEQIVRPELQFACAHPILAIQWGQLASHLGISFYILARKRSDISIIDPPKRIIEKTIKFIHEKKKSHTWSGVEGLQTSKVNSATRFEDIGGFIPGIEVAGFSKFYGCTKNQIMRALLLYRQKVISRAIPLTSESFSRPFKTQEVQKIARYLEPC